MKITINIDDAKLEAGLAQGFAASGASGTIGFPRNATAAEVKADIIAYITGVVLRDEQRVAAEAAANAVTPIDPT